MKVATRTGTFRAARLNDLPPTVSQIRRLALYGHDATPPDNRAEAARLLATLALQRKGVN